MIIKVCSLLERQLNLVKCVSIWVNYSGIFLFYRINSRRTFEKCDKNSTKFLSFVISTFCYASNFISNIFYLFDSIKKHCALVLYKTYKKTKLFSKQKWYSDRRWRQREQKKKRINIVNIMWEIGFGSSLTFRKWSFLSS